jgi:pSer/pThr/pTyr-binding forkhead associated (FHA) protein
VTFPALMRIDSLELLGVLAAASVLAAWPRGRPAAQVPAAVRATLRVLGLGQERRLEATCPLVIGREREADVVLGDPEVSRRHAALDVQGGIVFLRDLESSNGTFLNGRRVRSAIELLEGDEIDVGTTRLVVESLAPWT